MLQHRLLARLLPQPQALHLPLQAPHFLLLSLGHLGRLAQQQDPRAPGDAGDEAVGHGTQEGGFAGAVAADEDVVAGFDKVEVGVGEEVAVSDGDGEVFD